MTHPTCQAAVFSQPGDPIAIQPFEIPRRIEPGAALCKVSMSTVCGSDLHTISGRRKEPTPIILGHEIMGEVVALGEGLDRDGFGDELNAGDRVTWPIMAACGDCFYCNRRLPQKCVRLRKYGHMSCSEWPHLTGGYAEYIYLFPGTSLFRIPEAVPDVVATPANCALSTVMNAVETIGLDPGETVLIQGAGMLGLNLVALAAQAGAGKIFVADVNPRRLELAAAFGAGTCIDVGGMREEEIVRMLRDETDGQGIDVAFEVCGDAAAVGLAVEALRIGGRYLLAGLVVPGSDLAIDGNQIVRKCLTLKGIHNYRPDHLGRALHFLEANAPRFPYADLVGRSFALAEINEAVATAGTGDCPRVAVVPFGNTVLCREQM